VCTSLTVLHELSEANGPRDLSDLAAAVVVAEGTAPDMPNSAGTYICPNRGRPQGASDLDAGDGRRSRDSVSTLTWTAWTWRSTLLRRFASWSTSRRWATGPARSAGGTVTLTPLGRLLAESVFGSMQAVADESAAEVLAGIANCGHPHAADVTRMLSGGPAVGFRTTSL
jgi:hypothetical protein